jgi:hypothetical protein
MISVSKYLLEHIIKTPLIEEALFNNYLNLRQYAKFIKKDIENTLLKDVSISNIVISLSRIRKNLSIKEKNKPKLIFSDIAIKYPISEISYSYSKTILSNLLTAQKNLEGVENNFLNIISGNSEITIFINSNYKDKYILGKNSHIQPNLIADNLAALSVKFDPIFWNYAGVTYEVLKAVYFEDIILAETVSTHSEITLDIILAETVSTHSEITLIMEKKFINQAFEILNKRYIL